MSIFERLKRSKLGQVFDQMAGLGVGVATLAITLVVVFLLLSQTKANTTVAADGNSTAALNTLMTAVAGIPTWVPLIVIAVIGALLLGLVAMFRR
jgi:hypothetical protein